MTTYGKSSLLQRFSKPKQPMLAVPQHRENPMPQSAVADTDTIERASGAPLIERDGAVQMLGGDGQYRPVVFPGGKPIPGINDGWRASAICRDFAPLTLVEFEGPNGNRATWFVDAGGVRLGDMVPALPKQHQEHLQSALTRLLVEQAAGPDTMARYYGRICLETRLQLEALLPNVCYDRALEYGQTIAAAAVTALRTAISITPIADVAQARLAPELRDGWQVTTLNGRAVCMAVGRRSVIRLGNVPPSKGYYISLVTGPLRQSRRLHVSANGRLIAINPLSPAPYMHRDRARFGYWIPPELVQSGSIELTLEHALISNDPAEAFVLQGIRLDVGDRAGEADTALTNSDLMLRFQSLGDNCQFGFVQRHFGAEPMGLLRFAGLPDLIGLIEAGAEGLGEPGTVTHFMDGTQYMIRESRYGLFYHTFREAAAMSPAEVVAENEAKLRYLARKLIEDLEDGETIWITRRIVSNDVHEILALHAAMQRHGPAKLLWVTPAPSDRQPGDVEWLTTGLLKGYLASKAPNGPGGFNPDHWLLLCRNAYRAFQEH